MKNEHTPGPWVYGPEFSAVLTRDKQGTVAILLPLGHTRDDEEIDTELMDAHGRLMAAAPELLEALKDLLEYGRIGGLFHMRDSYYKARTQATNLVAKIEGDE